jgi:hypothetical protein
LTSVAPQATDSKRRNLKRPRDNGSGSTQSYYKQILTLKPLRLSQSCCLTVHFDFFLMSGLEFLPSNKKTQCTWTSTQLGTQRHHPPNFHHLSLMEIRLLTLASRANTWIELMGCGFIFPSSEKKILL